MGKKEADVKPIDLTVKWSTAAAILAVVAVGSLGALVAVSTITDTDTLSTVALTLAVVTFLAQLIIALAQTVSFQRQESQFSLLARDAATTAVELRTAMQDLLASVNSHYDRALAALISQAVPAAIQSSQNEAGPDISASDLRRHLIAQLQSSADTITPLGGSLQLLAGDRVRHFRWGDGLVLETFASETGLKVNVLFDGVGEKVLDLAIAPLQRLAPSTLTDYERPDHPS